MGNYFEEKEKRQQELREKARYVEDWFGRQPTKKSFSVSEIGYYYDGYQAFGYIYSDSIPRVLTKTGTTIAIRELYGYNESLLESIYSFIKRQPE